MWLLLGFMAYSIISTLLMDELPVKSTPVSQEKEDMQAFRFSFVEDGLISRRLDYYVIEQVRGRGEKAQCWSEVDVLYKLYTPEGKVVENLFPTGEAKRIRLGSGTALPGMERGLVDAAAGAKRGISMRKELAFAHPDFVRGEYANTPIGAIVEVKAVHPLEAKWQASDRLKIISDLHGTGQAVECGQTAAVVVKITNAGGDILFASTKARPLLVTAGSGQLPFALEKAVLGMRSGETRMVVAPQDYIFTNEMPHNGRVMIEGASLPADEAWIMEISSAEPYYPPH